jgi:hypothetical protein
MNKKLISISSVSLILVISAFVIVKTFNNANDIKYKKLQVENNISNYIFNDKKFQSEAIENINVEYDKNEKVYIGTIKFENNPKIMHIFVAENDTDIKIENN